LNLLTLYNVLADSVAYTFCIAQTVLIMSYILLFPLSEVHRVPPKNM